MGKRQREKGKRGEREVARKLKDHGYDARRGQQYCGVAGDADVIGLPGIHIEVKRVETFRLYDAMEQAKHDARDGEIPVVFHRKNDCNWVVVMDADQWIEMYKEAEVGRD